MSGDQPLWQRSASDLVAGLQRGEFSSVELCRDLIARREATDAACHALVWTRDAALLAEAEASDAARTRGEALPPLAGLPITIKENIDVTGSESTLGCVSRRGKKATQDAVTVASLRSAGALVLGKTNVPQLLLAQETDNAIYGRTPNPWHLGRSSGGSSGGEAAAVAVGASPCGMGTDIGGSIRIPAHFCGVFGLKPTVDRISVRGSQGAVPGQEIVRGQMGPLARHAKDLSLLMAAIDPRQQSLRDPLVPPIAPPDPGAVDLRGLRVGFYDDDGFLTPTDSCRRAVAEAAAALRAAGATLVPYTPTSAADIVYLWMGAISGDGGDSMARVLDGEPYSAHLRRSARALELPTALRLGAAKVMELRGEVKLARLLRALGRKPVMAVWDIAAERTRLRRQEMDAFAAAELDAVLCPAHACPSMAHGTSGDMTLSLSNPFRWTFLNFPAGVAPVTRVLAGEAAAAQANTGHGEQVARAIARCEAEGAGLPVGVQVAARPYREDIVLRLLQAIEDGCAASAHWPQTPINPGVVAAA